MNTKSCFIENDYQIDGYDRHDMLRIIWRANKNGNMNFDKLFDVIIVEANQKRKEVWAAINECDYIFLKTAFIGESAILLEEMCELALRKRIKNKVIVNFRDSDNYLGITQYGQRMLKILQARYNVKYVTQDTEEFKIICKTLFHADK